MRLTNQVSIKSRLIALLMGVGLGTLLISGGLGWLQFRRAFRNQSFEHLTSVRASKGKQLEDYINKLQDHISILSEDQMIVAAMVEFGTTYRELQNQTSSDTTLKSIDRYYKEDFLPQLSENVQSVQIPSNYRPTSQAGQYLQAQYIVNNSGSEKAELADAEDGSNYSKIHARYHPLLHHLTEQFIPYKDLYLIDFNSGDIVYSVQKNPDYATSLDRGPYRRSSLAEVVEAVRNDPGQGFVQVTDYKPYVPAKSAPTAFFAAPIYNGPHIVGIIAVQLPDQAISMLLTGNQEWEEDGLGKTGQVYVVGSDTLMRSVARPLIEDAEDYQESLDRLGLSPQTLNLVQQFQTSTLLHPIDTESVEQAFTGVSATQIVKDYRGVPVLSSYAPLRLKGLRWAILAEMDRSEAFGPVTALQIYMSILGVILMLLIAWLSSYVAQSFVSPIQKILDATDKIQAGDRKVDLELGKGPGKFGQLGRAIQGLLEKIQTQEKLVDEKTAENQRLLGNMMPPAIATRFSNGERAITESVRQVTLLAVQIQGLRDIAKAQSPEQAALTLNQLIGRFDEKAKFYGLETQTTLDDTYIAVCGLSQMFLDHQERTINFALELMRLVDGRSEDNLAQIRLQIGIHSGPMMSGIAGEQKFMYKLWGQTIETAQSLSRLGGFHGILVSQVVQEHIQERYKLIPYASLHTAHSTPVPSWLLLNPTGKLTQQIEQVQSSWLKLQPQLSEMVERFEQGLRETAPDIHAMLPQSRTVLLQQLMQTLQTIVDGLGDLEQLTETLQHWGKNQSNTGLNPSHYSKIGQTLLWAIEQSLGSPFSSEQRQAWSSLYNLLSGVIQQATESPSISQLELAPALPQDVSNVPA